MEEMTTIESISTFLDTNLLVVILFLGILSMQLIYSLMVSDVEERKFEFGLLRALGFNQTNLMGTIFTQGLFFAIPGLVLGLFLAALLNLGVRMVILDLV